LNYISLIAAIHSIANGTYKTVDISKYEKIPKNERRLFDLKIKNLTYTYLGVEYTFDLGIKHSEIDNPGHTDFYSVGKISDIGDLSTYYGFKTINAEGLTFKPAEIYPDTLSDKDELKNIDFEKLLKQGYTSIAIKEYDKNFTDFQMNVKRVKKIDNEKLDISKPPINLNDNATFVLKKGEKPFFAIINGFVYDLQNNKNEIKNGIVE